MKRQALLVALALACLPSPSSPQITSFVPTGWYEVVEVHDGDTLTLKRGGKKLRARVSALDCPELAQPYGDGTEKPKPGEKQKPGAKANVERLVADCGGKAHFTPTGISYDRVVGIVALKAPDGTKIFLATHAIENGWGWYSPGGKINKRLEAMQAKASKLGLGLWALPGPENPKTFRARTKKKDSNKQ